MKPISTPHAPSAIGPYSQAIQVGNFLFTSGQIALTPEGTFVEGGIEAQTKQVLENLDAVLKAGGATAEQVVKTTIFLANMDDFAAVNALYGTFFGDHKPARSTVAVKTLPKNALVEIEAIALIS
ncbi:RidA family protein [Sulfurospirillum sp. T05]|uniref:RidA family protein n=1 Tax=Sulfurospirillum tamanense TaxID=2813362 RepID=A0ABS2WUI1_9BACT|nr:RidA family protein [Sulfurospirillum tamanensis]MBN2965301.1 RidA family protein [Sulfurospirillum tamanensis]